MANIYDVAESFAAQIRASDVVSLRKLAGDYNGMYELLSKQYAALKVRVDVARRTGKPVSPAWVMQEERFKSLLRQARAEFDRLTGEATKAAQAARTDGFTVGSANGYEQLNAALGPKAPGKPPSINPSFFRLDKEAVKRLAGYFERDTPLRETKVLAGKSEAQFNAVRSAMLNGLGAGLSVQVTTAKVKAIIGAAYSDAARLVRTERFRAYRASTQETFKVNRSVVSGWRWLAFLRDTASGSRTCSVCIAMNGKEFPVDTPMGTHPNCRCSAVAITKSWAELGGHPDEIDTRVKPKNGESWFAEQGGEFQAAILGPAKYQAYREGKILLADTVRVTESAKWGTTRTEASLAETLRNAEWRKTIR